MTLGGYFDTRRNTWNMYGMTYGVKYIANIWANEQTRSLLHLQLDMAIIIIMMIWIGAIYI